MSYCLNPSCLKPQNTTDVKFCLTCGTKLLLKERYRAITPIGRGGFGITFLAVDEDIPSKPYCVIKEFYPQAQGTNTVKKAAELFNQEAMRLDELGQHPQIPELLAYFTQEDRQYLVQEFIDGQNLAQELAQNGVFTEAKVRKLLNDLLPVLLFCHSKHVIHRDIKPENIICCRHSGKPVLVDFGASKFATNTAINRTGTSIGSPEYVAIEQMRGKATFASDIYSLGATCVHLLTQRSPFDLHDIHNDVWIWRQYLQTPVSHHLSRILDTMIESMPSRRYQSAEAVLNHLHSQTQVGTNAVAKLQPYQPQNSALAPMTQIDKELAEVRTIFLGKQVASNGTQVQVESPKSPLPTQSIIDDELEQIKNKYLGNSEV